jgi:Mn2+/Fe2+ NRAMP family transporter
VTSKPWWRYVGPGIVSGASENDPTTVASMAVIGATTLYSLGWLLILVAPMLAVVQALGAHVATTGGRQLEQIVKDVYGNAVAWILLLPLLVVSLLTLGADLQGGTAAMQLLTGADPRWFTIPLAAAILCFLIFGSYGRVRGILSLLPLAFLAYVGAAFMAHPNWHAVSAGSFVPALHFNAAQTSGAIALLGTTLTAYAYVWITVEVAEERPPVRLLGLIEIDSALGTITAVASAWFILIATAATLGVHHAQVHTARDAAQALAPIAGRYASLIFAVGLLGSALLAMTVISSTIGYATAALLGWKNALDARFSEAPYFYAVIGVALLVAAVCGLFGLDAIKLLFAASIAGGLTTPLSLIILLCVAASKKALGRQTAPVWLLVCGWCVAAIVSAAAAKFLVQALS